MNDVINFKENSENGVVINITDKNSIISITVPSTDLYSADAENTCAFKVNEDGTIIINCNTSEDNIKVVTTSIKEEITKEEISSKIVTKPIQETLIDTFENIPEDLSEIEINKVLEFVKGKELKELKELKETRQSRIFPYSVSLTESGDIKITLVIYNGGQFPLYLPQMPIKLIDANKAIIIAELVDINAEVNIGKIGIIESIVSKEKIKENTINLKEWEITFAM